MLNKKSFLNLLKSKFILGLFSIIEYCKIKPTKLFTKRPTTKAQIFLKYIAKGITVIILEN